MGDEPATGPRPPEELERALAAARRSLYQQRRLADPPTARRGGLRPRSRDETIAATV